MVGCIAKAALAVLGVALVVHGLSVICAQADEYPNRPIRMIIPYPPGGSVAASARILAEKLGNILGQQMVIRKQGRGERHARGQPRG